jgi:arsenite methyltransferase
LVEELPIKTASVDWVISNCVIVLSPEKERVFAEIARVLKPGGSMLVSDIVAENLPAAVREDLGSCCSCVSGAISQDEYKAGLRRAGLVDIDIQTRIAYSAEQLGALVESELRETSEAGCCENTLTNIPSLQESIRQCADEVLSARIFARKPPLPTPSA